ncbi:MAG TPA: L-seryl-tRNA(Sec) selenium transferase [Steroidobacteraceae bacterium]|nr:L-seryl-tRNA(Sec) selenium transferase [Steroidobacteraceae bacterium]
MVAPRTPTGTVVPSDLPSVDRVMAMPALADLVAQAGPTVVLRAVREELEELRATALAGTLGAGALESGALAASVATRVAAAGRGPLRPLFNLTGIVLHSNMGRALLPEEAIEAVVAAARSPLNLEFDLATGRRGERDLAFAPLLAELTGAEAATAVNNNAAALVVMLAALAARREVLVSRGELVEIGGSFRLPEIMRAAGAKLVEVGTTNRTHLADYERAIGPRTALILKVHPSNYRISGFTSEVPTREVAALAHAHGVPLAVDLGSGALVDLADFGLPTEPVVRDTVEAGADLVTFSGDKLLGGPQAGLMVGRRTLIERVNRHPLKRAMRLGKLTIVALEAVLRLYRSPERLAERLTTLRLLVRPLESMRAQAQRLALPLAEALGEGYAVTVEPLAGEVGSGAQPQVPLPSAGLVVRRVGDRAPSLSRLARALRRLPRPVVGRLADDTLCLDLRGLEPQLEAEFLAQLAHLRA